MAREDLISLADRTIEEQHEIARKGGIASGKVRKEKKTLKETLLLLLEQDNNQDNITIALLKEAMRGNVKAFETIRDTMGQRPVEEQKIDSNITIVMDNETKDLSK
jgi:hypothetical protein